MNKIYKVIWSKTKNCYVVVSEMAKSHTKSSKFGVISRMLVCGVLACVLSGNFVMPVANAYFTQYPGDISVIHINDQYFSPDANNNTALEWDLGRSDNSNITYSIGVNSYALKIGNVLTGEAGLADATDVYDSMHVSDGNFINENNSVAQNLTALDNAIAGISGGSSTNNSDAYLSDGYFALSDTNGVYFANINGDLNDFLNGLYYASEFEEGDQYSGLIQNNSIGFKALKDKNGNVIFKGGINYRNFGNLPDAMKTVTLSGEKAVEYGIVTQAELNTLKAKDAIDFAAEGGYASQAVGYGSTALGIEAKALGDGNIAIGNNAGAVLGKTVGGINNGFNYVIAEPDQMAVSNAVNNISIGTDSFADGDNGIAIGTRSWAVSDDSVAIGRGAVGNAGGIAIGKNSYSVKSGNIALGDGALADSGNYSILLSGDDQPVHGNVALGADSVAPDDDNNVVSVGAAVGDKVVSEISGNVKTVTADKAFTRRIINVSEGIDDNDAVTVSQLNTAIAEISGSGGSTSYIGINSATGGGNEDGSGAVGIDSIAIGKNASATGTDSVAIGTGSTATRTDEVSFGNSSKKRILSNVANGTAVTDVSTVGQTGSRLDVSENYLRLKNADGTDLSTVALSDLDTHVVTNNYITVNAGDSGEVTLTVNNLNISNDDAITNVGTSTVTGENSTALGTGSTVTGVDSIAVGTGHYISGNYSGAFGDPNIIDGSNSYVIGNNSSVSNVDTDGTFVIGNSNRTNTSNTVVLGNNNSVGGGATGTWENFTQQDGDYNFVVGQYNYMAGYNNNVIGSNNRLLGSTYRMTSDADMSFYSEPYNNTNILGNFNDIEGNENIVLGNDITYTGDNAVIIGNGSTGVEDAVSVGNATTQRQIKYVAAGTADTDAVNVGQLREAVAGISGGTTYSAGNNISIDNDVVSAVGLVKYDDEGKAIATLEGTRGTKLTNLKAASLANGSTDAVIGHQLWQTNENIRGFAQDISTNSNNITNLTTSVTNALSSVSAISTTVDAINNVKADASLNNLTDMGRQVIASAAADAVQEYMRQNGGNGGALGNSNPNSSTNSNTNNNLLLGSSNTLSATPRATGFGLMASPMSNDDEIITNNDLLGDGNNNISMEVQAALDDKANVSLDNINDAGISVIRDAVANDLSLKADVNSVYTKDETDGFLNEKADITFVNDELSKKADITYIDDKLDTKANKDSVYTKQETDDFLSLKADKVDLNKKADVDGNNIDINAWSQKLATGKVAPGNTGLVNGGTVYDSMMTIAQSNPVQVNDSAIFIGKQSKYNDIRMIDVSNSKGEGRVMTGVITNPEDKSSAANVGYVNAVGDNIIAGVNGRFAQIDDKISEVGANAAAMSGLVPYSADGDEKWALSAAVGHYDSSTAGAVGLFYKPSNNVVVNVKGTVGSDENMLAGGITVALDKGSVPGVTKKQMVQTINSQANEIQQLKEQNKQRDAEMEQMRQQMALMMQEIQKQNKENNKK